MRSVRPTRPVAGYVGGKRHLAPLLVERIEARRHSIYAEPFVGMGGVFLKRRYAPPSEVINDLSRDVANLFRVLQRHYQALLDMLKWQITTRVEFDRLSKTDPETLTDLERAARFLYLQRAALGGKVAGRSFGVSPEHPARFDITRLQPVLEEVHTRLAGVVVECLPFGEFIERYDRPETLFYLDPPYSGSTAYYGKGMFAEADFERLSAQLASIEGAFILSINDTARIRELFAGFEIETADVAYTAGVDRGDREKFTELIISSPRREGDGTGPLFGDP